MSNVRAVWSFAALPLALPLAALPLLAACAPSPDAVCDHAVSIIKKELGDRAEGSDDETLAKLKEECVKEAETEKEMKGAIAYKKKADCIMAAASITDLQKCDAKEDDKKE
ncbi:MAG: hypothetical protein HC923_08030 [Myxococcales bacterium]|nr:hypothetical protein [Myxococcales bacterium]